MICTYKQMVKSRSRRGQIVRIEEIRNGEKFGNIEDQTPKWMRYGDTLHFLKTPRKIENYWTTPVYINDYITYKIF